MLLNMFFVSGWKLRYYKYYMNKDETEKAIKLLKKAIKEDYLCKSEVQEFYELFRENKVGIFLETGELYSCNKRNAERLIKKLSDTPTDTISRNNTNKMDTWTKTLAFVSAVLGVPITLLELIGLIQGKELMKATIEVATNLLKLILSLLDYLF